MKHIIKMIIDEVENDRQGLLRKLEEIEEFEADIPVSCYPFLLETLKVKTEIEETLASCEEILEQAHYELISLIRCK